MFVGTSRIGFLNVVSRDGKIRGRVTGHVRTCGVEDCLGRRVLVAWPYGKRTWPCTGAMIQVGKRTMKIN